MNLKTFNSRREWSKHETTAHEGPFKKRLQSGECPLCLKTISPAKYLSRHIGRHLRELSLASLPPVRVTDEDNNKDNKPAKGVRSNSGSPAALSSPSLASF